MQELVTVWVKNTHGNWVLAKNRIVPQERICDNPKCAELHDGHKRVISSTSLNRKNQRKHQKGFCCRECSQIYQKNHYETIHDERGRFIGLRLSYSKSSYRDPY